MAVDVDIGPRNTEGVTAATPQTSLNPCHATILAIEAESDGDIGHTIDPFNKAGAPILFERNVTWVKTHDIITPDFDMSSRLISKTIMTGEANIDIDIEYRLDFE
ncbi:hypothetical protein THAOC_03010, partial [Thalassiosira oceanica]